MDIDSLEGYRADQESDTVGKRKLAKQRCLGMCWNNSKDISLKEIAYCIHRHGLDINRVPEAKLPTVRKELIKLEIVDKKEQERKLIEAELARYKYPDNGNGKFFKRREFVEYYIDPDLFTTSLEAELAMEELSSYYSKEATKTSEYNYEYRDTKTYSRNITRHIEAMEKLQQQYIKLGGLESEFDISKIPLPKSGTLQEDVYQHREAIQKRFTDIGVSPTRANKIAITITQKVYDLLQ